MPEKPSRAAEYSKEQVQLVMANAKRDVYVCGPGAFVVLKALAFRKRGENKDAYDLYYHIRNYGSGVEDIAKALKPLLHENEAKEAIKIRSTFNQKGEHMNG